MLTTFQPYTVVRKPWRLQGSYSAAWMILSAVMLGPHFVGTYIGISHNDMTSQIDQARSVVLNRTLSEFWPTIDDPPNIPRYWGSTVDWLQWTTDHEHTVLHKTHCTDEYVKNVQ
jgi:hypothetical protein